MLSSKGIKALDIATQEFAARRMNKSINQALTGKSVSDIETIKCGYKLMSFLY